MNIDYIKKERYDVLSRKTNNDNTFRDFLISKTQFLPNDASNVCRIWHIKNGVDGIPKCTHCGSQTTFSIMAGSRKGYKTFCNHSCQMTFLNLNRGEEDTKLRNEKIEKTCLERYGVRHFQSSNHIKDKKKKTYQNRYGEDNPSKLDWVKEKKKQTTIINYGVENPSQSHIIHAKKSLHAKNKQIISQCGKEFNLEGYEPIALKELLIQHTANDILHREEIIESIGLLRYRFDNKTSLYHPDFYIKSQNKIIEVKSEYWFNRDFEKNLAKKVACLDYGFVFEFWIYESKKLTKLIL
jgi:hypothetical protein